MWHLLFIIIFGHVWCNSYGNFRDTCIFQNNIFKNVPSWRYKHWTWKELHFQFSPFIAQPPRASSWLFYVHHTKSKGCHKLSLVSWRGIFLDAIFSPREDSPSIINQVRDDERWWSTGGFISRCFPWNFLPVSPIKGFWQPALLCCTIHQPVNLHLSLQNHVTRL